MEIKWTEQERQFIKERGETCFAVAYEAMRRSNLTFEDIESINNHRENHRKGSNADRKYKKAAINKAVKIIAANAINYI